MASELSDKAVNRAVMSESLQHPQTLYPAAAGVVGVAAVALIGLNPITLGLFGVGAVLAGCGLGNQYLRRGKHHAKRYVDRLRADMAAEREAAITELRSDFMELGFARGLGQIEQLTEKYDNFIEVLDRQLDPGELTHVRYAGIAEQVFLGGLDNLKEISLALRSISTIDPDRIMGRLANLDATTADEASEVRTLNERLELRKSRTARVEDLLRENEQAMTRLSQVSARIASIRTGSGHAVMDMAQAMTELEDLSERADRYKSSQDANADTDISISGKRSKGERRTITPGAER